MRNTLTAILATDWFEDQRNQLANQKKDGELENIADSIQDFSIVFAHQSTASRRERLSKLWQCFRDFAAETTGDDGAPGALRNRWRKALQKFYEPDPADKLLTPLDAKHIACLVETFNSPEFAALVVRRSGSQPSDYDWNEIAALVDFGCVVQDQGDMDTKNFITQIRAVFKEL